jgi:hypothetical protein
LDQVWKYFNEGQGHIMTEEGKLETRPLDKDDAEHDLVMRIGALPFEQDRDSIKLYLPDKKERITITFALDGKVILGRFAESTGEANGSSTISMLAGDGRSRLDTLASLPKQQRDQVVALFNEAELQRVSLNPYGAEAGGVSREHAALVREDTMLTLIDLNSTNGTYLNGLPLPAFQSRIVRDGDELQLGVLKLIFQFGSIPAPSNARPVNLPTSQPTRQTTTPATTEVRSPAAEHIVNRQHPDAS